MAVRPVRNIKCDHCAERTPVHARFVAAATKTRRLCDRCANTEVAQANGWTGFSQHDFAPVTVADCHGVTHVFHFRTHLHILLAIEAFELAGHERTGYEFQILGQPEDDQFAMLGRLLERMRRALALQHVEESDLGWRITQPGVVRARIESDGAADQRPVVVIDGKAFSWDHFGHMLMSYEGWQFKLAMHDPSDEL